MDINDFTHLDIADVKCPEIKARALELYAEPYPFHVYRHISEPIEILWRQGPPPNYGKFEEVILISFAGDTPWGTQNKSGQTRTIEEAIFETLEFREWASRYLGYQSGTMKM